jgi:hypothetical protein
MKISKNLFQKLRRKVQDGKYRSGCIRRWDSVFKNWYIVLAYIICMIKHLKLMKYFELFLSSDKL